MKAFVVTKYAKEGAVRAEECPEPTPERGEVLVHVEAASVNPLDSKLAAGEFKALLPYKPSFVLGHDVAGVVMGVGPGVTGFAPGDRVFARAGTSRSARSPSRSPSASPTSPSCRPRSPSRTPPPCHASR